MTTIEDNQVESVQPETPVVEPSPVEPTTATVSETTEPTTEPVEPEKTVDQRLKELELELAQEKQKNAYEVKRKSEMEVGVQKLLRQRETLKQKLELVEKQKTTPAPLPVSLDGLDETQASGAKLLHNMVSGSLNSQREYELRAEQEQVTNQIAELEIQIYQPVNQGFSDWMQENSVAKADADFTASILQRNEYRDPKTMQPYWINPLSGTPIYDVKEALNVFGKRLVKKPLVPAQDIAKIQVAQASTPASTGGAAQDTSYPELTDFEKRTALVNGLTLEQYAAKKKEISQNRSK